MITAHEDFRLQATGSVTVGSKSKLLFVVSEIKIEMEIEIEILSDS